MNNEDGTRGGHWDESQTSTVLEKYGFDLNPVEFYATMNMMYSDYVEVAKKYNINTVDFYASMSYAFLKDKDAQKGKLCAYRKYIAQ